MEDTDDVSGGSTDDMTCQSRSVADGSCMSQRSSTFSIDDCSGRQRVQQGRGRARTRSVIDVDRPRDRLSAVRSRHSPSRESRTVRFYDNLSNRNVQRHGRRDDGVPLRPVVDDVLTTDVQRDQLQRDRSRPLADDYEFYSTEERLRDKYEVPRAEHLDRVTRQPVSAGPLHVTPTSNGKSNPVMLVQRAQHILHSPRTSTPWLDDKTVCPTSANRVNRVSASTDGADSVASLPSVLSLQ